GRTNAAILDLILPAYFDDAFHLASTQFFKSLEQPDTPWAPHRCDTSKIAAMLAGNIADRVALIENEVRAFGGRKSDTLLSDSQVDAILAAAEGLWGREFIEKARGRRTAVRKMLEDRPVSYEPLPRRVLHVAALRRAKVEAECHGRTPD